MTTSDLDRSADDALRQYGIPSILWLIYGSIATFALVVIGCFQRYRYVNPDTSAAQLTRAVDALGFGQDLVAIAYSRSLLRMAIRQPSIGSPTCTSMGWAPQRTFQRRLPSSGPPRPKGLVLAQLRVGEFYLAGTEMDPDYGQASDLLSKAAAAGNAEAQRLLGQMYAAGLGRARDPFMAAVYFSAAAIHGDRLAAPERHSMMPQMSPDQIAQIRPEMAQLGLAK